MKKLFVIFYLLFNLTFWSVEQSHANTYSDCVQAFQNGEHKTAVNICSSLAEQGDVDAQNLLGVMYDMGKGVIQDYKMAAKWYKLSAEQGGSSAQLNLSDMYSDGKGVIQDDVYAHMWANIARANGVGYAGDRITSIEGYMSRSQIEKAQDLARECVAKNYKNC